MNTSYTKFMTTKDRVVDVIAAIIATSIFFGAFLIAVKIVFLFISLIFS